MTFGGSLVAVALGGAIGAVARWAVTLGAARFLERTGAAPFPLGTIVVNVVGCFALALLIGLEPRAGMPPAARLFLGTGLLGALTTFSTFGTDAHGLWLAGRGGAAALYLGATLVLAGVAVLAGWAIGRGG